MMMYNDSCDVDDNGYDDILYGGDDDDDDNEVS
jgi:hypothetical protein